MARKQPSASVAEKSPKVQSTDKCPKVWEKNRRDKLKGLFEELGRLLPHHDPSVPLSRMKVVHGALSYIRELQAQNEDLLNGGFDEIHRKKLESWKKRVKELLSRVDQLTGILRTANIHVPPLALEAVPMWTKARPKQWTDKIFIPDGKVGEVFELIAEAKRKKKQSDRMDGKKPTKRRKKGADSRDNGLDSGSKENLPTPIASTTTQTAAGGLKPKKQVVKSIVPQIKVVPPPAVVTGARPTPSILQGSIMTPIPQPSTFILTSQGNLLPVITPNANLLTPVVINKPPMLVVQQPAPRTLPVILARPPMNKRRIQRESTVMTFSNKMPIPALSSHSHTRRGGKCTAHKTGASNKAISTSTSTFLNNLPLATSSLACSAHIDPFQAETLCKMSVTNLTSSVMSSVNNEGNGSGQTDVEVSKSLVAIEPDAISSRNFETTITSTKPTTLGSNSVVSSASQSASSVENIKASLVEHNLKRCPDDSDNVMGQGLDAPESSMLKIESSLISSDRISVQNDEKSVTSRYSENAAGKSEKSPFGAANKDSPLAISIGSASSSSIMPRPSLEQPKVNSDSDADFKLTDSEFSTKNPSSKSVSVANLIYSDSNSKGSQLGLVASVASNISETGTFSSPLSSRSVVPVVAINDIICSQEPSDFNALSKVTSQCFVNSPSPVQAGTTILASEITTDAKMTMPSKVSLPPLIDAAKSRTFNVSESTPSRESLSSASSKTSETGFFDSQILTTLEHTTASISEASENLFKTQPSHQDATAPVYLKIPESGSTHTEYSTMPLLTNSAPPTTTSSKTPSSSPPSTLGQIFSPPENVPPVRPKVPKLGPDGSQAVIQISPIQMSVTSNAQDCTLAFKQPIQKPQGMNLPNVSGTYSPASKTLPAPLQNSGCSQNSISSKLQFRSIVTTTAMSSCSHASVISPNVSLSSPSLNVPSPSILSSSTTISSKIPFNSLDLTPPGQVPSSSQSAAYHNISEVGSANNKAMILPQQNFLHPQNLLYPKVSCSVVPTASLQSNSYSHPAICSKMPNGTPLISHSLVTPPQQFSSGHTPICSKAPFCSVVPEAPVQAYSSSTRMSESGFLSSQALIAPFPSLSSLPYVSESIGVCGQASSAMETHSPAQLTSKNKESDWVSTSAQILKLPPDSLAAPPIIYSQPPPPSLLLNKAPGTAAYSTIKSTLCIKKGTGSQTVISPTTPETTSNVPAAPIQSLHADQRFGSAVFLKPPEIKSENTNLPAAAGTYSNAKTSKPIKNEAQELVIQSNSPLQTRQLPKTLEVQTQVPALTSHGHPSNTKLARSNESGGKSLSIASKPSSLSATSTFEASSTAPVMANPVSNLQKPCSLLTLPQAAMPASSKGSYVPPSLPSSAVTNIVSTPQYTGPSWASAPHFGPSSLPPSHHNTEVSWSPISALRAPHLQQVSANDNSWLIPPTVAFNETKKPLPTNLTPCTASSSWRPLPNDIFWNSCGENWTMPMASACKEIAPSPAKKSKNVDRSAVGAVKALTGNISGNTNDAIHWPAKGSTAEITGSQIGLYPFCTSDSGLYSASVPVPVSEPTWTPNITKSFGQDGAYSSIVQPNKQKSTTPSSYKSQGKDQGCYPPTIPYLPPSTNYCPQEFRKDSFQSSSSSFLESCPVTPASSNQITYSKSSQKQLTRSSAMTSKSYSNISNLVSSGQQNSNLKTNQTEAAKQNSAASHNRMVTSVSTPTYIPSPSKVAVSDTFFPTCHYSVADSGVYNPFAENSYTSTLLKQTLVDSSSYAVNLVNAYAGDVSSNAPYPINAPKTFLRDPPYSFSALKTSISDSYYPGVPVYSSGISSVTPNEPALYSNSVLKSVSSEAIPVEPTRQSSSSVAASQKMPLNNNVIAIKETTQSSGVNNAPISSYSSVKPQEPIVTATTTFASTLGTKAQALPSSKCIPSSSGPTKTKTSESLPVWNSSYFSQATSAEGVGAVQWGQAEYSCLPESKDGRPKPHINWMTEPESRSDGICPPEDPFQPRYHNSFGRKETQNAQNIFDYCGPEDETGKGKTRKKDIEVTGQDFYGWAPMKVDPLVVPGTLPTLVGDLALGGDSLPIKRSKTAMFLPEPYSVPPCSKESDLNSGIQQEPFANLSKNIFDFSQNDIPKSSSAETIVLKNIFELPVPPTGKEKPAQGQNSFLSVSQLVDSHIMEPNEGKNEYSYYTQKPGKTKRSSGWKCNEKKCHQGIKTCSSYSAEALLRSQDAISSEPDFTVANPATFSMDFPPDSSLMDTSDVITGPVQNKPKTYSQRYRKQDCWKGQDLRQGPAITFPPTSSAQPFSGKAPHAKGPEPVALPFPYLPDPRVSAPPLPSCGPTPLPFPRFPSNPSTPLLSAPSFPQRKPENVHFAGVFPPSPARPCGQSDVGAVRYPGPKKPYTYPRSSKAIFPPFSPSFSGEGARKSVGKSTPQSDSIRPSFPPPPQPTGPSGSSLANFNLSTIFPEMNKKGSYPYP